ncbi:MAG: hypothetical protein QW666_04650 [Candidatus Woesearchaeota archaeon]
MVGGWKKKILRYIAGALIAGGSLAYTGYIGYLKPKVEHIKISFESVEQNSNYLRNKILFMLLFNSALFGIPLAALGALYIFRKFGIKKECSFFEAAINNPAAASVFCMANSALLCAVFDKSFEMLAPGAIDKMRSIYPALTAVSGAFPALFLQSLGRFKAPELLNYFKYFYYSQKQAVCSGLESKIGNLDKMRVYLKKPHMIYCEKTALYLKYGQKENALLCNSRALKGLRAELKEKSMYVQYHQYPVLKAILKIFPRLGSIDSFYALSRFDFVRGLQAFEEILKDDKSISMRFGYAETLHALSDTLKEIDLPRSSGSKLQMYLSKEFGNESLERLIELKTDKEWSSAIKNLIELPNVHDYFESVDDYRVFRVVLDDFTKDLVILKESKDYLRLSEERNLLGIIDKALRKIGHKAIYSPGILPLSGYYYLTEFAAAGKRLTEAYLDSGNLALLKEAARCTALIHALVPHKGDAKNIFADVESQLAMIDIPPELKQSICDSLPAIIAGFDSSGLVFDSDAHTGQFHCEEEGALVRYDTPYRGATAPESDLNKLLRRGFLFSRNSEGAEAIDDIICSDYLPTFNNAAGRSSRINDKQFLVKFRKYTPLRALAYWLFARTRRQREMPAALDTIKNASFDIEILCSRGDLSLRDAKLYSEFNNSLAQLENYSFVA